jgi:hypothetical protein
MLFPMPPAAANVKGTKFFSYPGDYYYPSPFPASGLFIGTGAIGANHYSYIRYTGVLGKKFYFWPVYASIPIPPPTIRNGEIKADPCGHIHLSYGIWAKKKNGFSFGSWWPFGGGGSSYHYELIGGGGASGVRAAGTNGRCELKVDNPLKNIDKRFGWGSDYFEIDLKGWWNSFFNPIEEIIAGALINTHGWGSCTESPIGSFKVCSEPVRMNAWTL